MAMKRITMYDFVDDGYLVDKNRTGPEIVNRLGQYEDLGYMPEELKEIIKQHKESSGKKKVDVPVEKAMDILRNIFIAAVDPTWNRDFGQEVHKVKVAEHPVAGYELVCKLWENYLEMRCMTEDRDIQIKTEDAAALMELYKIGSLGGTKLEIVTPFDCKDLKIAVVCPDCDSCEEEVSRR